MRLDDLNLYILTLKHRHKGLATQIVNYLIEKVLLETKLDEIFAITCPDTDADKIFIKRGWKQYNKGVGDQMKIDKFDSNQKIGRVPLVKGGGSNGEKFVLSVLADGSGVVLEFEDDEAYFLSTQELVKELLSGREKK